MKNTPLIDALSKPHQPVPAKEQVSILSEFYQSTRLCLCRNIADEALQATLPIRVALRSPGHKSFSNQLYSNKRLSYLPTIFVPDIDRPLIAPNNSNLPDGFLSQSLNSFISLAIKASDSNFDKNSKKTKKSPELQELIVKTKNRIMEGKEFFAISTRIAFHKGSSFEILPFILSLTSLTINLASLNISEETID